MAGVTSLLTKVLKKGLKNKKMLNKIDEEPVRKMLDEVPSKKFIEPEKEAKHQEWLEDYAKRGQQEEIPTTGDVEEALGAVNAPAPAASARPEPRRASPDGELTPEEIQGYRKQYNITPSDDRKKSAGPWKPKEVPSPEEVRKAREKLPEFSDMSNEEVVDMYRNLGY